MIHLPDNRRMGKVSYTPSNWEDGGKETLKLEWAIRYRYYDDNTGKKKDVWISNFNLGCNTLAEKRKQLRDALAFEIDRLQNNGWDPITKKYTKPLVQKSKPGVIDKYMAFSAAIEHADKKIDVSDTSRVQEINWLRDQILKEAKNQGLADTPICEITRRNLNEICEKCAVKKTDNKFSKDKYNRLRKVLSYYYKVLLDPEVVESNIPSSLIKKKTAFKKIEVTITPAQQKKVSEYLRLNFRPFWLYLQVFYNSAPRSTEMMRLKVGDVDLVRRRVKFTILKGKNPGEKYRLIPDIAVKYWKEIIGDAPADWYVFGRDKSEKGNYIKGKGLQPSPVPIQSRQITLRWRRLILENDALKDIGITFYQLKKLRLTDVGDNHGIERAAALAAEDTKTVVKHYDMNTSRGDDDLRRSGKKF